MSACCATALIRWGCADHTPTLERGRTDEHHPRHPEALAGPAAPAGPSDAALIREQDKMIEHMARIVAEQAVKLRIMEIRPPKKC